MLVVLVCLVQLQNGTDLMAASRWFSAGSGDKSKKQTFLNAEKR